MVSCSSMVPQGRKIPPCCRAVRGIAFSGAVGLPLRPLRWTPEPLERAEVGRAGHARAITIIMVVMGVFIVAPFAVYILSRKERRAKAMNKTLLPDPDRLRAPLHRRRAGSCATRSANGTPTG